MKANEAESVDENCIGHADHTEHCIPAQEFDNEICRFCYVALPNAS